MTTGRNNSRGLLNLFKSSLAYFAVVFGTGFVLGPIRILYLVPRVGERIAELLEMPVMIAVSAAAASWVLRRFSAGASLHRRVAIGFLALLFMVLAEFTLVLRLRGISIGEYLSERDPVSGTAYYLSLLLFACFPALFGGRRAAS